MNKNNNQNLKRFLPLSICCIIPVLLLFTVPTIGFYSPKSAILVSSIAPFICPLVMGGVLFFYLKEINHAVLKIQKMTNMFDYIKYYYD